MSGSKKPQPGSPEQSDVTPEEQQQQDQERVQGELLVTDVTRQVRDFMGSLGLGGSGAPGRTSFEGHELNTMIDLIDSSSPEHLEEAGRALLKARTAIDEAAQELGDFIKAVDWEGESGIAFRDWGNGLVAHAVKLGGFAQAAGTQIMVAGTGLASVRNSLPPRDNRLDRTSVDDIEAPKRIEGNPEYAAALKVEKDRQEAINQANRLASYYAVSEETLAAQEPPRFDKQLEIAMPRPRGRIDPGSSSVGSEAVMDGSPRTGSEQADTGSTGVGTHDSTVIEAPGTAAVPGGRTSTEIDSVAAPPAPTMVSWATHSPSSTSSANPGAPAPPMAGGFVNPVTSPSRWSQGSTGMTRGVGRSGAGGSTRTGGPTANGRAGAPTGRPAPMGGGSAAGTSGRGAAGGQSPVAGRPGVTGGRPIAGGQAGGFGTSGPHAGRTGGIVGGTPQRAVPGVGTPGNSRGVPRGTVIGAGGTAQRGASAGGAGRRGVIGAGGTSVAPRQGGRGTPRNGVVGRPRGGPAGSGSGIKGFTAGGTGLVRGPAGRSEAADENQDGGTPLPDYLMEDRETWGAGRPGVVPPVVE